MTLPEQFRTTASQQRTIVAELMETPDVLTNAKSLVSCIAGIATANMLDALADVMDYQRGTTGVDSAMQRRKLILEKNDAIRNAAARGDWAEFDRLTNGGAAAGTSGGDAA